MRIKLGTKKVGKIMRDGSIDVLAGRRQPKSKEKAKKYRLMEENYNLFHLEGHEEHYQGLNKKKD